MIRLDMNEFLIHIVNTKEPIQMNRIFDDIDSQTINDVKIQRIIDALNKNTESSELYITQHSNIRLLTNFFDKLSLPINFKSIGMPAIDLFDNIVIPIPYSIINLKLKRLTDIFKVDFQKNINLQTISINEVSVSYTNVSLYATKNADLSHMYELHTICIKLSKYIIEDIRAKYEKFVNELMKNVKLPYGCKVVFHYR